MLPRDETTLLESAIVCVTGLPEGGCVSRNTGNAWSERDPRQAELFGVEELSELLLTEGIVGCLSFACRDVKYACDAGNNCLLLDISDLPDRSSRVRLEEFYRAM